MQKYYFFLNYYIAPYKTVVYVYNFPLLLVLSEGFAHRYVVTQVLG